MSRALILLIVLLITVSAQEPGARYLIITHDNFYDDILPLAEWKHKKGMKTKIAKLSEIGSSATEIRNYILNAYNTWQIPPEYLLLVGAPNYIPFPTAGGTISDNYYTDLSGDLFNEILSGRLTVHNVTEAQTVVNKILLYERYPNTTDSLWFTNACLIANEDYGAYPPQGNDTVYWNDIRLAKNHMLANGYNTIDTFSCGLGNNANSVINAVNNGRSFVVYRGQGLNNWYTPFGVNADNTSNGSRLPIVLSMTCRTMGTGSSPAAAEKWLLTGTPTTPRGGAGYFATTTVGGGFITFLRSRACRGFFDALFVDRKRTFGECCEGGRRLAYDTYGWASEYRGFTTLGDPEMNIWTDTPCSLIVNHPPMVPIGSADITVNVAWASNGIPMTDAIVCILANEDTTVYAVDTTDTNGDAVFNLYPQIVEDTLYVTVTGKNLLPYEGFMFTTVSGDFVGYYASAIDDTTGGNANGQINPVEVINLRMWIKNYGENPIQGVMGVLQTSDPYTMIIDSLKSYGNMNANEVCSTGTDGYDFSTALNIPDGHMINFDLICRDINDSTWVSHFGKQVHAPILNYYDAVVLNGELEPGETVSVAVGLVNEGSATADSLTATLRTLSNFIYISDSTGYYAQVTPGNTASNNLDPFVIIIDSNAPNDTTAQFTMILNSTHYVDTISFSLRIGRKHFYIWNPDPTPIPGNNMFTILTNLGYIGDYGTSLAADLEMYQALFICLGVYPNNHVINSTSPEASGIVDYLQNQNGRVYLEGGDVWYYDPPTGYDFSLLFGIDASSDGSSDMGPVTGEMNTFTQSMNFSYAGENSWMDHVDPSGSGFLIFHDGDDYYNCGVANDAGNYRTVGTSFELGLLIDATTPSTRATLLDSIMHFFGISTGITETTEQEAQRTVTLEVFPNPCRGTMFIRTQAQPDKGFHSHITIYDVSGRMVRQYRSMTGDQLISWSGQDEKGRDLPGGIYFVRFTAQNTETTQKVVFLK
jgi:hypothetical protein